MGVNETTGEILAAVASTNNSLQIWHLYVLGAFNRAFEEIQELAYMASLSQLVPPQQYTRASSMNSTLHYGSIIIAPALAGTLY